MKHRHKTQNMQMHAEESKKSTQYANGIRFIYTHTISGFSVFTKIYDAKQPCCTKYKDRRMETQDPNHWLNTEFVNEMTYDGWNDIRANKQRAINGNRKWNTQTPICAVHSLKQYHRRLTQFAKPNSTDPNSIRIGLSVCLPANRIEINSTTAAHKLCKSI